MGGSYCPIVKELWFELQNNQQCSVLQAQLPFISATFFFFLFFFICSRKLVCFCSLCFETLTWSYRKKEHNAADKVQTFMLYIKTLQWGCRQQDEGTF